MKALASIGAVNRATRDKVVDVESEREESGRGCVLGVDLKGCGVLGEEEEGGGGWWWWSLAVAEALSAITTAG